MIQKKTETIDITLIHLDYDIYPRAGVDEELVETYRQNMEDGIKFPPLVVQKGTYTLIDGYHRFHALKKLGKEKVEVEILDIPNSELRAEAVRRHIKLGKRFTPSEVRRNVILMRRRDGKTEKEIAEIVGRTEGRISQICSEYADAGRYFDNFNSKDRKKPIDHRKKVDAKKKEEILEDLETGLAGKEIAKKHGISQSTISQIKANREEWVSSPVFIEAETDQVKHLFEVAFAQKLLKRAQ